MTQKPNSPKKVSTVTNTQFAKDNEEFKSACASVNLEPTPRQASKWRRKVGKAYKTKNNIPM